jgi:hypothetical protein
MRIQAPAVIGIIICAQHMRELKTKIFGRAAPFLCAVNAAVILIAALVNNRAYLRLSTRGGVSARGTVGDANCAHG